MKYAIDRIEENFVTIENLKTGEISEINKIDLPANIKEGSILILKNNKYELDLKEERIRRKSILEKFNKLRKKDV